MTNKIQLLEQQSAAAEKEIENLKKQINSLIAAVNSNTSNSTNDDTTGESDNLKKENEKLKMQINVLKRTLTNRRLNRTIMATDFDTKKHMISIHDSLYCLFEKAIQDAYPDLPDAQIIITSSGKFSDYQCNSAMPISKLLSKIGKKENPLTVANNIVSKIPSSPLIEKLQVAGAGFVNIFLKRDFVHSILTNVLKIGHVLPPPVTKRRIVVDMSSPNVAKEMHVGHLRSTVIGESISRLLEYLGHDVLRLNHIGDWGTQFGMLVAHLQDKYPNYLSESPPISDLQSFYKESKVRFDNDEEFKKRAYACVVKLQAFEPSIIQGWKLICDVSREAFENIYKRLDVTIVERGESFYQNLMEDLVKELEEKNLLEEDEGRKIMWGENRDGIPLTIVKTDGGFTYDTSDLTSLKHRIEVEKAEWVIYVVDGGQSVHFASLESCAKRAKILTSRHRFDHVPFGVVLGEDKKKFKTRSGDTVRLSDLLDEGLRRAEQKLKEKERHKVLSKEEFDAAKEAVAYGCIKYSDLSHNRNNEYIFSFDKMLDDKGNTAVYLLYSLTRIRSIARTANFTQDQLKSAIENSSLSLEHEKEWKLAKVLVKFPDIIFKITKDLCLHTLCEFCYEISCAFTEFYDSCYCVEKNKLGEIVKVNVGRILLTEVTAMMMEQCFSLLGIKPVEKM